MRVTIDVDSSKARSKLRTLKDSQKTGMYKAIGKSVVSNIQQMFFLQKSPWNQAWKPVLRTTGGPILRLSGQLFSSIQSNAYTNKAIISTNKRYASTHQFGETIVPKKGKYLIFKLNGATIFALKVTIPARPFMPLKSKNQALWPPRWKEKAMSAGKNYILKRMKSVK